MKIAGFYYDSLDSSSKDFLKNRILYEDEKNQFDYTFLFNAFNPNLSIIRLAKILKRKGFMKKRKDGYYSLTKKAYDLDENVFSLVD